MTREEELIRIAKKLDKMVYRNNTVRVYFDTLLYVACFSVTSCSQMYEIKCRYMLYFEFAMTYSIL